MIRVSRTVGFTLCAVVIGLQGCSEIQKAVGNTKQAPDEFAVVARPPLSVPPNFALRPAVSRETPGEAKMRQLLNTASAEPGIRQTVNRETSTFLYEEEYLIDNLLFWREKAPRGVVVDAQAEQKRLQENAALGNEPTAGTTPVIERKRKGLF